MTKVLNIISNGLNREGITTTQLEYMKHLDTTGLQVDIAAVHDNSPEVIRDFEERGCRVIEFPDRNRQVLRYYISLFRTIRREKYQVVHLHGSSAILGLDLLVARMAGVKKRIAHSRNTHCTHEKLDRLLRPLFYGSYTDALACGREAGEFLFGGRPFTILYNGKDFEKFRYNEETRCRWREKLELGDKLVLGFVGNLNEQKNPLFLMDLMAELTKRRPDVHLLAIGDGPRREEVEAYAREKGVRDCVTFTGRVANVNELIQAADVMLLPSLYEGLPNVVLEWQIAGLPCLVSDQVTRECRVTELVSFLPIDQGVQPWIHRILTAGQGSDRGLDSQNACAGMKNAGFEIRESAKRLKKIYTE